MCSALTSVLGQTVLYLPAHRPVLAAADDGGPQLSLPGLPPHAPPPGDQGGGDQGQEAHQDDHRGQDDLHTPGPLLPRPGGPGIIICHCDVPQAGHIHTEHVGIHSD